MQPFTQSLCRYWISYEETKERQEAGEDHYQESSRWSIYSRREEKEEKEEMTTDEAYEVLKHIDGLKNSIDKLEFRALSVIACTKPKLHVVPKITEADDRFWRHEAIDK